MRKYVPIYYLLCVLLIFGAFAAMAQNAYGLTLLGVVAGSFAIVFLVQLVSYLTKKQEHRDYLYILEGLSLILVCAILSLRVFYVRFLFVEEIFILSGLVLAMVFALRLAKTFNTLLTQSKIIAWTVVLFHASIIFYVLSMVMAPLYPGYAEPLGIMAFVLLIGFGLSALINRGVLVDGEKQSIFSYVLKFRDRSVVLMAIFLIFTGYMGLTKIGAVPKMYSDEYPQAYFELVNQSEQGVESPVNGKYKHEEFKQQYDRFVTRHIGADKK